MIPTHTTQHNSTSICKSWQNWWYAYQSQESDKAHISGQTSLVGDPVDFSNEQGYTK